MVSIIPTLLLLLALSSRQAWGDEDDPTEAPEAPDPCVTDNDGNPYDAEGRQGCLLFNYFDSGENGDKDGLISWNEFNAGINKMATPPLTADQKLKGADFVPKLMGITGLCLPQAMGIFHHVATARDDSDPGNIDFANRVFTFLSLPTALVGYSPDLCGSVSLSKFLDTWKEIHNRLRMGNVSCQPPTDEDSTR